MSHNFFISIGLIALAVAGVGICSYRLGVNNVPPPRVRTDTLVIREPVHDTITEVRYVTRRLPVVRDTTEVRDTAYIRDTVQVIVPIETKVYHQEDVYYAEISGYEVSLDYLEVYPKTEYRIETVKERSEFNFGLTIGYGGGRGGLTPFFGVGITYNPFARMKGKRN